MRMRIMNRGISSRRLLMLVGSAYSLILAASAQAQYPGYTGWIAQVRPPGMGYGVYDWTGLTLTWNSVPFSGPPQNGSQTVYTYLNLTGGSAGGPTGNASYTHNLSGTSTFKWKWIPPDLDNNGQPDHGLFLADPLYILTNLSIGVEAWPHSFPPVGLNASGSVSNGAGWTRNFNGIPGVAPPEDESAPRRIASTTYSGDIASLLLSPSANVSITGTQMVASGSTSIFVWQGNNPILLTGVDIFGKPEIGDGKNQFAYDSTVDGHV